MKEKNVYQNLRILRKPESHQFPFPRQRRIFVLQAPGIIVSHFHNCDFFMLYCCFTLPPTLAGLNNHGEKRRNIYPFSISLMLSLPPQCSLQEDNFWFLYIFVSYPTKIWDFLQWCPLPSHIHRNVSIERLVDRLHRYRQMFICTHSYMHSFECCLLRVDDYIPGVFQLFSFIF